MTKQDICKLTDLERALIDSMADEIDNSFKISRNTIEKFLMQEIYLPKNQLLRKKIEKIDELKEVLRLSEYKQFRKKVRSEVYKKLRQYKTSDSAIKNLMDAYAESKEEQAEILLQKILESHVSTRERLENKELFRKHVCDAIPAGSTVIDIGCGFNPLLYPVGFYNKLSCFIAVDKDQTAINLVQLYADKNNITNLKAHLWDVSEGVNRLEQLTGVQCYSFALLFKLIPVLNRTEQTYGKPKEDALLSVLGNFPANQMIATVSRESMTKYESIEKREVGILKNFMSQFHYIETTKFYCGSEIGFILIKKR